ncbi:MAG: helix-turn-helix domain-containing protein [Vicinamibacterales bacterium]
MHKRVSAILLLADGCTAREVASQVGLGERIVRKWARRYEEQGSKGLKDKKGRGRKPFFPLSRCRRNGEDRLRASVRTGGAHRQVGLRRNRSASEGEGDRRSDLA